MPQPFVFNLTLSALSDEEATVGSNVPTEPTKPKPSRAPTYDDALEERARELRRDGLSISKIVKETGIRERRVKELVKDVPVGISTPFDKSVSRVYELARNPQGIKDYELRNILHKEYGCKWDSSEGRYHSSYNADVIKRIKQKVRQRASMESSNVIFVMDWVDEKAPTESRHFLEDAALTLMTRLDECVNEFMELHATRQTEDSEEADLAQRKQGYAARQHLLKLVSGLGAEPVSTLIRRSTDVTNSLDGTPDLHCPALPGGDRDEFFPEPSRNDPFLDYVESLGWLG